MTKEQLPFPWIPIAAGTAALSTPKGCVVAVQGAGVTFVPGASALDLAGMAKAAEVAREAAIVAEADARALAKATKAAANA